MGADGGGVCGGGINSGLVYMDVKKSTLKKAAEGLEKLLSRWMGERWASAIAGTIAGALLGLLVALGALTLTDCTGTYNQSAAGDISVGWSLHPVPIKEGK